MSFKRSFGFFLLVGLSFLGLAEAQQDMSCRSLASDYARLQRSKEKFDKNIEVQKQNCGRPDNSRLSDVLLNRNRQESCLREIEKEKSELNKKVESTRRVIEGKISGSPAEAPGIVDCRRALDQLNLENSPQVNSNR